MRLIRFVVTMFALLLTQIAAADNLPGTAGGPLTYHGLIAFVHVVLLVFWLGPDVAIYICGRTALDPKSSGATRIAAVRMMRVMDLMPRICASLMLTFGGLLSELVGLEHPPWQMAGIVLLGPVWLAAVLFGYFRQGTEMGVTVDRLDGWFRMALVVAIVISVGYSTSTGRLSPAPYVGAKLLLFAAVILFGMVIRARMRPLFAEVNRTATGAGAEPGVDAMVTACIGGARPWVFAVWAGLLLAALLGLVKPGAAQRPAAPESAAAIVTLPGAVG